MGDLATELVTRHQSPNAMGMGDQQSYSLHGHPAVKKHPWGIVKGPELWQRFKWVNKLLLFEYPIKPTGHLFLIDNGQTLG